MFDIIVYQSAIFTSMEEVKHKVESSLTFLWLSHPSPRGPSTLAGPGCVVSPRLGPLVDI